MVTNEQKEQLWEAYRRRRPTRVPVTYGANPRMVLFDPKWNPRGITFQECYEDAAAAVEVQLQFMEFKAEFLHQYCDHPLGRPAEWAFYVDNQNTYDSAYFGAELVFRDGQVADVSPPLSIGGVPEGAATLALVMDDPDAPGGTFDHWLVWNIPATTSGVPEGAEPQGLQGRTDFGRLGYGGPCPPSGTHRYFFKLYALDRELDLPKGSRKPELEAAMAGHVLARAQLQGNYRRGGR